MAQAFLGLALLVLLIPCLLATCLRGISWNVNGVSKLKLKNHELSFLASFDIVLLQETFSTTREETLELHGFIPHHQLGRRHQWGLTSLLRINAFVGGTLHRVPCPFDWMIVSRWRRTLDIGLVIINVYVPVHTAGFGRTDAEAASEFIRTLLNDFPSDGVLIGGDLNVDRWRVIMQRQQGRPIATSTRFV